MFKMFVIYILLYVFFIYMTVNSQNRNRYFMGFLNFGLIRITGCFTKKCPDRKLVTLEIVKCIDIKKKF